MLKLSKHGALVDIGTSGIMAAQRINAVVNNELHRRLSSKSIPLLPRPFPRGSSETSICLILTSA